MSTVAEIKRAISRLSRAEFDEIVERLHELEEEEWDRRIGDDARSGRLDALAAGAWEARASGTLMDL